MWSIVRLANTGPAAQSARVEVFGENGERLPIGPTFEIKPGQTRDVRIDGTGGPSMCWARLRLPSGVEARGFVEVLKGNSLEDFPRELHELSKSARWATLASEVEGKQMYFLNTSDHPTDVTFCAARQNRLDACAQKRSPTARYRVGPNSSIAVRVRKLRRKFFITETSRPGAAILALFDNGPGFKQTFGSKSSIEFGDALP